MDKIIQAAILILIALGIIYFLVPLLSGFLHLLVLIVVIVGAIIGLMKIGGMWF